MTFGIVYGLIDPRDQQLRYVGKTIDIKHRMSRHLHDVKKSHKNNWIKSLKVLGLKPIVHIIEECHSNDQLNESEIFYIQYFRFIGCNLTNMKEGGDGWLPGRKFSDEHRRKLSISHKGRTVWNKGLSNDKTKALIDSMNKVRLLKPSHLKGKVYNEESRIKNSRAQGGRPFMDQNGKIYQTIHGAARELNITATKICAILKGRRKTVKGYSFTYLESNNNGKY